MTGNYELDNIDYQTDDNYIVCPFCGYKHNPPISLIVGKDYTTACRYCNKQFMYHAGVNVYYYADVDTDYDAYTELRLR